jgi:phage gpG-like protein
MVSLITFTLVIAWFIAALFLSGIIFSLAFKNFDLGYAEGWQNCRREYGKIGKILADNADLDEIMVIRYDDQLPHRYKRVID